MGHKQYGGRAKGDTSDPLYHRACGPRLHAKGRGHVRPFRFRAYNCEECGRGFIFEGRCPYDGRKLK
jgi:hypothetical protein